MKIEKLNPAVIPVIFSLLAVAVEPIIVKLGYKVDLKPFELLVIRFISAFVVILPFCGNFKLIEKKNITSVSIVCFLFMITNVFIYLSLIYLDSITVITITTTTPLFVALVNFMSGKEIIYKSFWYGFLLCFTGVILLLDVVNYSFGELHVAGFLFIGLAVVCSTLYRTQMDRLTKEISPSLIAKYIFISNGICALLFLPFVQMEYINMTSLRYGLWLGCAAVIGNVGFLTAVKLLGSTKISIIGILQRPILIIVSAIVLGESLNLWQVAGIAMVIGGVKMAKVKRVEKRLAA